MWFGSIRNRMAERLSRYGLSATLADLAIKAINRVVVFKVLKCVRIGAPSVDYLQTATRYRCGFLDRRVLLNYSRHPQYELPHEFVRNALAKGDECFGIMDGDVLASYGWYSNQPTDTPDGLTVHFDDKYIYMYNGFTHPDYRGQRLHAIGMTMALKEYLDRGFKGLVSTVDWNNFNSLKSVYRMGYEDFGEIYMITALGRDLIYRTRGCRDYGFALKRRQ